MIELPPSLLVEPCKEIEAELYGTAKKWLEAQTRADGIHASELLTPLRAYWKRKLPSTEGLNEREVGLFLVGKVLHAFVEHEGVGQPDLAKTDEGGKYDEELELWYSPDKLMGGKVIEVKTSRSFKEPRGIDDLDSYIQQVLIYLACEQVTEGEIWVLYVNLRDDVGRTSPAFRVFKVSIDRDHLPGLRRRVATAVQNLVGSLANSNPANLPLCPEWMCRPEYCPYFNEPCRPVGRHGSEEYLLRTTRGSGKANKGKATRKFKT